MTFTEIFKHNILLYFDTKCYFSNRSKLFSVKLYNKEGTKYMKYRAPHIFHNNMHPIPNFLIVLSLFALVVCNSRLDGHLGHCSMDSCFANDTPFFTVLFSFGPL